VAAMSDWIVFWSESQGQFLIERSGSRPSEARPTVDAKVGFKAVAMGLTKEEAEMFAAAARPPDAPGLFAARGWRAGVRRPRSW
jgi:hypothetical protein